MEVTKVVKEVPVKGDDEKIDDGEAYFTPKLVKAESFGDIRSPFDTGGVGKLDIRKRGGWHQTWIRKEDVEKMRGVGYRIIKKSKQNKFGAVLHEEAGRETGEIMTIQEGNGEAITAMECPQELIEAHVLAVSARSKSAYMDKNVVLNGFNNKTGRDLQSKKEQIHVAMDVSQDPEVIHTKG